MMDQYLLAVIYHKCRVLFGDASDSIQKKKKVVEISKIK